MPTADYAAQCPQLGHDGPVRGEELVDSALPTHSDGPKSGSFINTLMGQFASGLQHPFRQLECRQVCIFPQHNHRSTEETTKAKKHEAMKQTTSIVPRIRNALRYERLWSGENTLKVGFTHLSRVKAWHIMAGTHSHPRLLLLACRVSALDEHCHRIHIFGVLPATQCEAPQPQEPLARIWVLNVWCRSETAKNKAIFPKCGNSRE